MIGCDIKLKINGEDYLFRSQSDLNRFLYDNRNRLNGTKQDMYKLSVGLGGTYNPQDEALMKLAGKYTTNVRETYHATGKVDVFQLGEKFEGSGKDVITGTGVHKQYVGGKQLMTPMNRDDFKRQKVEEFLNNGLYKTELEAETFVEALFVQWDKSGIMGTALHMIPQLVFANEAITEAEVVEHIKKENPKVNVDTTAVNKLMQRFLNVKQYLQKIHGNDAKFVTEISLSVKNDQDKECRGTIDLLVVDKHGVPHIYDFKTSTKHIDQYSQSKTQTYKYQLGFYRQILGKLGLDISKTKLGIIPVQLTNVDFDTMTVNDADVTVNDISILNEADSHLELGRGYMAKKLNQILPIPVPEIKIGSDYVDNTAQLMIDAFGYEPKLVSNPKDVNYFIKRLKTDSKGRYFNNKLDNGKKVYVTDANVIEKVTQYLNDLNSSNINAASSLADNLAPYIDGDKENLYRQNDKGRLDFDQAQFMEYRLNGWAINRDLEHLGILIMYHSGRKVMDVLNITANNLGDKYELPYGETVLGSFLTNGKVNDPKILSSNVANIELLRSMMLINDIFDKNSNFNDYKIGQFKVLNQYNSKSFFQNQDFLLNSFNQVINQLNKKYEQEGKSKIENNFNHAIKMESFEDKVIRMLEDLINGNEETKFSKMLDAFKQNDSKTIVARLDELLEAIGAEWDGANVKSRDFNTPLSRVAIVVAEARMHYHNSNMRYYNPMYNIAYEYAVRDLPKWHLPGRGTDTSLMSASVDPLTNEFERKVFSQANNRVISRTDELAGKANAAFIKYQKGHVYAGSDHNMFDTLFEEGPDNNFSNEFKLKNPYDPKTKLTEQQREYSKFFLLEINRLLHPNLNLEDEKTQDAKELISSGEWFKVPLMRAGFVNKLTAGGRFSENVKKYASEKYDSLINVNEQLNEQKLEEEKRQHEEFEEFTNSMLLDDDSRTRLLNDSGVRGFSRNLSEILLTLGLKTFQQQEIQAILPAVRASLIFTKGFFSTNNIDAKNLQEYLLKYLQTKVYGKMHVSENLRNLYGHVQAISAILGTAAIGTNPVSITREFVQGLYNNMLFAVTKKAVIKSPSFDDLMFGYAMCSGYMLKDAWHVGKLNGFARMFHGIMGGGLNSLANDFQAPGNMGGKMFQGNPFMKLNHFPDFLHRISFLIGFMKMDGIYDAYSWNGNELVYNWKKDKRFELFVKYKDNPGSVPSDKIDEYRKQEGLYQYMIREFANQGLRSSPNGPILKYGDDLPKAYTNNQIDSIKDVINSTHGHMNQYDKTQAERTMYVSMYLMFKSWLKTKVNTYTMKGDYYKQGEVKPLIINGKQMYRHSVLDDEGNEINSFIDDNPDNGVMEYAFIPSYQEGIWESMKQCYKLTKQYGFKEGFKEALETEVIKKNMKYMGGDLLALLALALLAELLINWEEYEKEHGATLTKMSKAFFEAPQDNNAVMLLQTLLTSTEPPVIAMSGNWLKSIITLAVSPSQSSLEGVAKNVAVYRSANDIYNQLTAEAEEM